ncbi:MAG: hypothetical protein LUD84_00970 [Clostridiales bacterium]|nr:hypothetical protein [Clostridiales bacterium]
MRAILEIEAPLSEELLLKRISWCFGREKVTKVVQQNYEYQMHGCQQFGITGHDGFLYLAGENNIVFRGAGEINRDIKQIALEELAAGMREIISQNMTVDKNGLYRTLAQQCGVKRVGKAINERFDRALQLLSDVVSIDGEQVTVK